MNKEAINQNNITPNLADFHYAAWNVSYYQLKLFYKYHPKLPFYDYVVTTTPFYYFFDTLQYYYPYNHQIVC